VDPDSPETFSPILSLTGGPQGPVDLFPDTVVSDRDAKLFSHF
jgi:hypothetical protein